MLFRSGGELPENYMELGEGIYEEEVYEEGYGDEFDETYEEEEFEK
mgnify:CR=1 FL=1